MEVSPRWFFLFLFFTFVSAESANCWVTISSWGGWNGPHWTSRKRRSNLWCFDNAWPPAMRIASSTMRMALLHMIYFAMLTSSEKQSLCSGLLSHFSAIAYSVCREDFNKISICPILPRMCGISAITPPKLWEYLETAKSRIKSLAAQAIPI